MSKIKKIYSVAEAKKLLKACGYKLIRQGKHPIYGTEDAKLIFQRKGRYALTVSKDPLRRGTLDGLCEFLAKS